MPATTGKSRLLATALGVVCVVVLALVSAISPTIAIVALVGAIGVGMLLPRGDLAVAVFTASTYFEVIAVGPGLTPVKLLGGIIVVTALMTVLLPSRTRAAEPVWRGSHVVMLGLAASLVMWGVASVSWATDAGQVRSLSVRLLLDVLVFASVPVLVRSVRSIRMLGWWCVLGGAAGAAVGIVMGTQTYGRATGMFADPNEFASATIVAAIFAIVLGESDGRSSVRWGGRLMTALLLLAVASSASRTGMIAVGVAFLVLVVTARGVERVRLTGMLGISIAAILAWLTLTPAGMVVSERFTGENSTGRTDLWRVAMYQFEAEPLHGVGLGNYPVRSAEFLRRDVQNIELFIRAPRTVHNTPLELLSELGIVGFTLYYTLVLACLGTIARALRIARSLRNDHLVNACRGILASIVALLSSSLSLSALYVELQWVLMGACIAAYACARKLRTDHDIELEATTMALVDLSAAGSLELPVSQARTAVDQELPGVTR